MNFQIYSLRLTLIGALFGASALLGSLTVSAQSFPFPQHVTYTAGTIKPSHVSQTTMDNEVLSSWSSWKSQYLKPAGTGKLYVKFNSAGETVSEAHGYGMLLAVIMGEKSNFDQLYAYYIAHPSVNNSFLMAWKQNSSFQNIEGADSATDGDMDIAYSMLLADKQWGSAGTINYKQRATNMINAIMQSDVNQTRWNLKLGDWATGSQGDNTRPSDFMIEHMKAYKAATGDTRWDNVINETYDIINTLFNSFSPNTGLIPDFVVPNGSSWKPAPANFLESPHDGDYNYNSCRTPWRFPMDYFLTGDTRALTEMQKINTWIKGKVSSNPSNVRDGYTLSGTTFGTFNSPAFYAPFGPCAMLDSAHQTWLNNTWDKCAGSGVDGYYEDSIEMFALIIMSCNYWMPSGAAPTPDFTISATPSSRTIIAGGSTTYTVTLGNVNAFSGSVNLTVSGLPSGVTGSFSPVSVSPPGTSTLTINSTAGATLGTATLTITGTSGALNHSTTVSLTVNPPSTLPAPWVNQDVGAVGLAGSASFSSGTFTLNASGADIWSTADEFHFVNQSVTGDVDIRARVTGVEGTHAFAKAGVMIRESLAADAKEAMVALTASNGVTFVRRIATAGTSTSSNFAGPSAPFWIRVTRVGNTFTAFRSSDGVNWTTQGVTNITMASQVFVGLALSAHNDTTLNTSTFDNVSVTGPAADFTIAATPSSRTITVGNSTTYTVNIGAVNGFSGNVDLTASGLPANATASFSPNPVAGAGSSTLTITTAANTPATTSTITITGTSGALNHSTTVTLVTQPALVPDFTIAATPSSRTITVGNSTTYTVTIGAVNGFTGNVDLTASGLPANATASFNPTPVAGAGSSTLTITTAANTPATTSTITITGTSGALNHSTTVTLITQPAPVPDFSISATPSSQTVTAGGGTTYTVTISAINGFSGSVDLTSSGLPSGAAGSFNPTPVTGGAGSSTLTVTTATNTTTGTVTVTITGTSGSLVHSTTVSLTVNPASQPGNILQEAEWLAATTSAGQVLNVVVDALASGGNWVSLLSSNVNQFVEYTVTNVPAGTYGVGLLYKQHQNRGIHSLTVDGVKLDGDLNQYSNVVVFKEKNFGNIIFTASGNHAVRLTVTGKDPLAGNHNVSADAIRLTATNSGWLSQDIGAVGLAGSFSQNAGTYTVAGSGSDIWTTGDQFRYAYQNISGNVQITARVVSENQTHAFAKAGVMIRASLATNSVHAAVLLTPTNGVSLHIRPSTGGTSINVSGWVTGPTPPQWVRLVRAGNTFTGFYSANGTTWTQIASTNVTMSTGATIGMSVSSHNNAALNTATIDNVNIQ